MGIFRLDVNRLDAQHHEALLNNAGYTTRELRSGNAYMTRVSDDRLVEMLEKMFRRALKAPAVARLPTQLEESL